MRFSEKIKELRKEKRMSQAALGQLINGDARQISLYENDKMFPSVEAIKKLSKTLNVSADYLLFEKARRKPLDLGQDDTLNDLQDLKLLNQEDREAILKIIKGLVTKTKFQQIAEQK